MRGRRDGLRGGGGETDDIGGRERSDDVDRGAGRRLRVGEAATLKIGFFALAYPVATWYSYAVHAQHDLGLRPAFWGLLLALSSVCAIIAMRSHVRLPAARKETASAWAIRVLPLASIGLVLSPSVSVTAVLLVVFGTTMGITQITLNQRASEREERLRKSILPSCHGFFSVGVLCAGLTDFATAGSPWSRAALTVSLLLVAGFRALVHEGTTTEGDAAGPAAEPAYAPAVRGTPHVGTAALLAAAVTIRLLDGAVNTWHSYLIEHELGFAGLGGAMYAAYAAGGILVRFAAEAVQSRFGVLSTTALLGPVAVMVFAMSTTHRSPVAMGLSMVLLGGAVGIAYPEYVKLAARSPDNTDGRKVSQTLAGGTVGSLLANPLIGALSDAITVRRAFLLLDAVLAATFVHAAYVYHRWRLTAPDTTRALASASARGPRP